MLGMGMPQTAEEWKRLFDAIYGGAKTGVETGVEAVAPLFTPPGLRPDPDIVAEREAREAYGPITPDVDTAAVLADKQRVMEAKPQSYTPKIIPEKPAEDTELDDFYSQLFLQSLMENMRGGKPGQAPGVVVGGRTGELPSMMGQFRRQRKPWWIV
jgi:type IV secretory pathway VirB10-like protein